MRNLELCSDIAETLNLKCGKLKAMTYLFSEKYTAIRIAEITTAIQSNPEAFIAGFAIIEDMIENLTEVAETLTGEIFRAKKESS